MPSLRILVPPMIRLPGRPAAAPLAAAPLAAAPLAAFPLAASPLAASPLAAGFLAAAWLAAAWLATAVVAARADDPPTIAVTIKDHHFSPAEIHVPTGKPVTLHITNEDATVEEFDSTALKVEKVIAGGTYGTVRLRPLGPGRYPFMGEYHADTAQGVVISE
jgi:plastocyanin